MSSILLKFVFEINLFKPIINNLKIQDLVEPSKKLAEMVNKKAIKDSNDENENDVSRNDGRNETNLLNINDINDDSSAKKNCSING